jgi:hypothetical protein
MGCFHGLSPEQQGRYATGLAAQLAPGGRFMLYAADPLTEGFDRFGIARDQVERIFSSSFAITRAERGKFGRGASTWYWMSLKP